MMAWRQCVLRAYLHLRTHEGIAYTSLQSRLASYQTQVRLTGPNASDCGTARKVSGKGGVYLHLLVLGFPAQFLVLRLPLLEHVQLPSKFLPFQVHQVFFSSSTFLTSARATTFKNIGCNRGIAHESHSRKSRSIGSSHHAESFRQAREDIVVSGHVRL